MGDGRVEDSKAEGALKLGSRFSATRVALVVRRGLAADDLAASRGILVRVRRPAVSQVWVLEYHFKDADGEMYWEPIRTGTETDIAGSYTNLVTSGTAEADRLRYSRLEEDVPDVA